MGTPGLCCHAVLACWMVVSCVPPAAAQESDRTVEATPATKPPAKPPAKPPEEKHSRIFGIIPNYRTYPIPTKYEPLTAHQKFKIAVQDSFDPGTFLMAAGFGGLGQITNATPSFGQGVAGYARYFSTSYADLAIGDFMTEAIYPTLLHQDPRYFRRGTGSTLSRVGYAVSQIFVTHNDSGRRMFNFSEILGNSTAVAISNAYYPDNRNAHDAATKLGVQVGVDMFGNVLKEFWPDVEKKIARKRKSIVNQPGAH